MRALSVSHRRPPPTSTVLNMARRHDPALLLTSVRGYREHQGRWHASHARPIAARLMMPTRRALRSRCLVRPLSFQRPVWSALSTSSACGDSAWASRFATTSHGDQQAMRRDDSPPPRGNRLRLDAPYATVLPNNASSSRTQCKTTGVGGASQCAAVCLYPRFGQATLKRRCSCARGFHTAALLIGLQQRFDLSPPSRWRLFPTHWS